VRRLTLFFAALVFLTSHAFAVTVRNVPPQMVEVCKSPGCKYSTITAGLAAITDASVSKRYTLMVGPGRYDEGPVVGKSYVMIVGSDPNTTILRNTSASLPPSGAALQFPADATEAGVQGMMLVGGQGVEIATSTVNVTLYVDHCILGSVDSNVYHASSGATIDTVHSTSSATGGITTVYVSNSIHRSQFDNIAFAGNIYYIGYNNDFRVNLTGFTNQMSVWRNISFTAQSPFFSETGSRVNITTDNTGNAIKALQYTNASGSALQGGGADLSDVEIIINTTNASRTQSTTCLDIGTVVANSFGYRFVFNNVRCRINQTSTSGAVVGMAIASDADYANTPFRWMGGRIELAGGASRTDVTNAVVAAGATVLLYGVEHTGVYSGAGTTNVVSSPLNATQVIRNTPIATAPATCSIGDQYMDTSGAVCFCTAGNTWTNVSGVGACT
jgi:hypothetical protein